MNGYDGRPYDLPVGKAADILSAGARQVAALTDWGQLMGPRGAFARIAVSLAVAVAGVIVLQARQQQSWWEYKWVAADTTSYDYQFNVLNDWDGTQFNYRAYWESTVGGFESEGVFYQSKTGAPWGYTNPVPVLRTTGVRVIRYVGTVGGFVDRADVMNQTGVPVQGYTKEATLGYLRRSPVPGVATIPIYDCTLPSWRHFATTFQSECQAAGGTSLLLGYAFNNPGPGLALRYRCANLNFPYDHLTSRDTACEGTGLAYEGPLGYFRTGSTITVGGTQHEVSGFPDGAYVAPVNVIKDGATYYMSYSGSPHYSFAGPFNEIFVASSTDGVTWTPHANANGDPIAIITYRAAYRNEVIGRGDPVELMNAFGVGGGRLMKVGSEFYHYYIDSSTQTGGTSWRYGLRKTVVITSWTANPALLTDENNVQLTSAGPGGPLVVFDENPNATNKYWMFFGNADRTAGYWAQSVGNSATMFTMQGYLTRTLSGHPYERYSVHGVDALYPTGTMDSRYQWYIYTPGSPVGSPWCTPWTNACGVEQVGLTRFCPSSAAAGCH